MLIRQYLILQCYYNEDLKVTKDSRTYDATSLEIVLTGNMKIEICTHSRCSELVLNANKLVLEKSRFSVT